jgi:hypothetical protein
MKLKEGDTVGVVGTWHGENQCDLERYAWSSAGSTDRRVPVFNVEHYGLFPVELR